MEIKIDAKSGSKVLFYITVLVGLLLIYLKLDFILQEIDNTKPKAVVAHGFDYQKGVLNMMPVTPNGAIVQGSIKLPEVEKAEKPEKKEKDAK